MKGYMEYHDKDTAIIYHNNVIKDSVKIGHFVLIREGNFIGENVRIGSYTEIAHDVHIQDDVQIHSNCFIPEHTLLKKGCWIGPSVTFVNDPYPQTDGKFREGATVEEGAIVGANSTIMCGVTIGKGAIVGAGSTVIKDVKAGEVWCGNPAMFIKFRKDIDEYSRM